MTEERLYEIVASRLSGEKLTKEEDDELQNWLDCSEEIADCISYYNVLG